MSDGLIDYHSYSRSEKATICRCGQPDWRHRTLPEGYELSDRDRQARQDLMDREAADVPVARCPEHSPGNWPGPYQRQCELEKGHAGPHNARVNGMPGEQPWEWPSADEAMGFVTFGQPRQVWIGDMSYDPNDLEKPELLAAIKQLQQDIGELNRASKSAVDAQRELEEANKQIRFLQSELSKQNSAVTLLQRIIESALKGDR